MCEDFSTMKFVIVENSERSLVVKRIPVVTKAMLIFFRSCIEVALQEVY